jgi:hypothetical protein
MTFWKYEIKFFNIVRTMLTLFETISLGAQLCYWVSTVLSVVSVVQYLDFPSSEAYQDGPVDAGSGLERRSQDYWWSTVFWRLVIPLSGSVPFILSIMLGRSDSGLETSIQQWTSPLSLVKTNRFSSSCTNAGESTISFGSLIILPNIVTHSECVSRHIEYAAVSAFAALSGIFLDLFRIQLPASGLKDRPSTDVLWSRMAFFLTIFLSLIIVRPADVLRHGSQLSLETASLFERVSFSAAGPVLALGKARGLNIQGFPTLDIPSQSRYLTKQWNELPREGQLWKKLVRLFWRSILRLCILVSLQSLFGLAAPAFLHKLLQNLEGRARGEHISPPVVWLSVFGFGSSLVLQAYAESWILWVATSKLDAPLQGLLSALVFQKSVRRPAGFQDVRRDDESEPKSDTTISVINLLTNDRSVQTNTLAWAN